MNIKLIVVSKTDVPYIQTGLDEYIGRLKHYCDLEIVVIALECTFDDTSTT